MTPAGVGRAARDPKRLERLWRDRPTFAPQAANGTAASPLTITGMRAWRIKEPVGGRRYTVVEIETRGGIAGYGEGGVTRGVHITEARPLVVGRRAADQEYFRQALAATPAIEAAVSNACLDVLARQGKVPLYQFLGGPTRFKARVLASPMTWNRSGSGRRSSARSGPASAPPRSPSRATTRSGGCRST